MKSATKITARAIAITARRRMKKTKARTTMESILQKEKVCMVCKTPLNLECHHVFGGPRRKLSEKYGLKVWLCHEHHTGNTGVHFNKDFMDELHEYAQTVFESLYGEEEFFKEFGKNYKKGEYIDE